MHIFKKNSLPSRTYLLKFPLYSYQFPILFTQGLLDIFNLLLKRRFLRGFFLLQ